jgi:hypothetical protein
MELAAPTPCGYFHIYCKGFGRECWKSPRVGVLSSGQWAECCYLTERVKGINRKFQVITPVACINTMGALIILSVAQGMLQLPLISHLVGPSLLKPGSAA